MVTEASRLCRGRCLANAAPRIDRPRKIVLVLSEAVLVLAESDGRNVEHERPPLERGVEHRSISRSASDSSTSMSTAASG